MGMGEEKRIEFHEKLCLILGSRNCYFQPPENVKLSYPCIVYRRSAINTKRANNSIYGTTTQYDVTVIGSDPDAPIAALLMNHFKMAGYVRQYVADNLNHDVLQIKY